MRWNDISLGSDQCRDRGQIENWIYFNCLKAFGGEGGIRTPDRLAPMPHFECGTFNHSATSPGRSESAVARGWLAGVLGEVGAPDKPPDRKFGEAWQTAINAGRPQAVAARDGRRTAPSPRSDAIQRTKPHASRRHAAPVAQTWRGTVRETVPPAWRLRPWLSWPSCLPSSRPWRRPCPFCRGGGC
jgi:hypothetical protein